MRELLVVGAGGFLGAVARFWLSGWVHRVGGAGPPWGTLTVNLLGCAALGALLAVAESRLAQTPEMRLFLTVGILSSFTTFSTLSLETLELLRRSAWIAALAYTAGSLLLGVAAILAGRAAVRWLAG